MEERRVVSMDRREESLGRREEESEGGMLGILSLGRTQGKRPATLEKEGGTTGQKGRSTQEKK
jgi:hypothetical protein